MKHTTHRLALLLSAALVTAGCAPEPERGEELAGGGAQGTAQAPPVPPPSTARRTGPWPEAVVREVLAMEQSDQRVRETLASLLSAADPDTAAYRRAAAEQESVDRANTTRLKEIIREHGWPAKADVGSPAATAAFLVAQHAVHDIPFQKEYLAFVQEEFQKGQAPGDAVALLTDVTRVAEGQRQLYGTQINIEDGRLVVQPIEDEARVDERRAALGLGTLAEYVARVKQVYGIPE
jgi:hypothetical protein